MTMKKAKRRMMARGEDDWDDDDEGEGFPDLLEPAKREDCE